MGLFDKVAESREPKPEVEKVFRDAPETKGQRWFREEAERRKQLIRKEQDEPQDSGG